MLALQVYNHWQSSVTLQDVGQKCIYC